ncbi:MAG: translation initiation factor IF-2 [Bacillota bacterium]|jgi:translation initiation factor IF-2
MGKIRVYELAKELEMESKDVIRRLGKMGAEVKNHMSTVDEKYEKMLRDIVRPKLILEQKEQKEQKREQKKEEAKAAHAAEQPQRRAEEKPAEKAQKASAPRETESASRKQVAAAPAAPKENAADEVKKAPEKQEAKPAEKQESAVRPVPERKPASEQPRQQGVFARTDQPRQQGVFARTDQPRQQGVFAKSNQPRQQGVFAKNNRNRNDRSQGQRGDNRGGQARGRDGQNRYQNRDGQNRGQNRDGQNRYQNRDGQNRYQNRDGQARGGDNRHQNRDNQQNRGRGQSGGQGFQRDRGFGSVPPPPDVKAPDKKDSRRFEQKKKNNSYDSRKKDMERRGMEGNMYRNRPNRPKKKNARKEEMPPVVPKTVVIGETVIISELAKAMSKTAAELIKALMGLGFMATVNQEIDAETATILGEEFGITVEVKVDDKMEILVDEEDDESTLEERPPIVTVMGHVDHGKTSLLDAIRNTNVIAKEAGGITQHIGAYQVEINGRKITFLDTPGHEAFTEMRARGAQVTDIAILVVAADDGVMPQTIEAINHAKAADVPIVVAINKIDKPGANVDKIRQELMEYELVDEEWGGSTIMVPISAKKEEGIENLLEMVLLVADMQELKSNPNRNARGTVIESKLDKGRGPVATVLVQKGTLHVGDILVCGTEFAKVRAMVDEKGRRTKAARPSMPVEVLGFSDVPPAGEIFVCVDEEKDARYIAEHNAREKREHDMDKTAMVSLDDLFRQISEGAVKDLNIVLKADVHGSVEALSQSIQNLSTDEVRVNIIHKGVGAIVDTDVKLAEASNALIIGFNVRPDAHTKRAAEAAGVEILMYRVIYEAIDSIKAAMSGLLDPEYKEVIVGHVEVRDVIKVPKVGAVAGCYVVDGKVTRNAKARVLRNGIVIHEGDMASLRRFKDDVKEVQTGYECGICIEDYNDIKIEDQIEIYDLVETKRSI